MGTDVIVHTDPLPSGRAPAKAMTQQFTYSSHDDLTRADRLRRNRISAKKCRQKRKAEIDAVERRVDELSMHNAQLLNENDRLKSLIQRLQQKYEPEQLATNENHMGGARKRVKRENREANSLDSSESAVPATSPQMEFILLAVATTVLCSTIAKTTTHCVPVPAYPARAPMAAHPDRHPSRGATIRSLATRIIQCLRKERHPTNGRALSIARSKRRSCKWTSPSCSPHGDQMQKARGDAYTLHTCTSTIHRPDHLVAASITPPKLLPLASST